MMGLLILGVKLRIFLVIGVLSNNDHRRKRCAYVQTNYVIYCCVLTNIQKHHWFLSSVLDSSEILLFAPNVKRCGCFFIFQPKGNTRSTAAGRFRRMDRSAYCPRYSAHVSLVDHDVVIITFFARDYLAVQWRRPRFPSP